jgi:tetratricopeptide (TPR) repeat protein
LHEIGEQDDALRQLEQALNLARAMGHRRLEATTLCNLGLVARAGQAHQEALAHFEAAVDTAVSLADARLEGQFRGYLGQQLSICGHAAQAERCLVQAEALLSGIGDLAAVALVLCQRCMGAAHLGDASAAAAALQRAEEMAANLGSEADFELARALRSARALVSPCC